MWRALSKPFKIQIHRVFAVDYYVFDIGSYPSFTIENAMAEP